MNEKSARARDSLSAQMERSVKVLVSQSSGFRRGGARRYILFGVSLSVTFLLAGCWSILNLSPTGIREVNDELQLGLCITATLRHVEVDHRLASSDGGDWETVFEADGHATLTAGETLTLGEEIDGMVVSENREYSLMPGDDLSIVLIFEPRSPNAGPLEFQPIFEIPAAGLGDRWLNDVGQLSEKPCS